VVCDQHEYWSNWIGKTAHYNTFSGKIVKKLSNWDQYEKENLQKADLVITVAEKLRLKYINNVKIDPSKIVTVPNTPSKRVFNEKNVNKKIVEQYKERFVLIYVGVMSILRGVDILINALPELEKQISNIHFLMVGRFSLNCNPLEMAHQLGVGHLVEYVGWVQPHELPSYIAASKICIHLPNAKAADESNNTIATKVFQYAAMGKPIIISESKMMKDFVIKNNLGLSIKNGDVSDLIEKVQEIHNNYEYFQKKVKTASNIVTQTSFFWESTIENMLKAYQNL
jgi:glycosyltransferase involved in cell wall biosynthesis